MKAVTAQLPADEQGWAFEIKWDGMRILTIIRPDHVTLMTSNGIDATARYPELQWNQGVPRSSPSAKDGGRTGLIWTTTS